MQFRCEAQLKFQNSYENILISILMFGFREFVESFFIRLIIITMIRMVCAMFHEMDAHQMHFKLRTAIQFKNNVHFQVVTFQKWNCNRKNTNEYVRSLIRQETRNSPTEKKKQNICYAQVQFENYFVQNVGRIYTKNNINHLPFS